MFSQQVTHFINLRWITPIQWQSLRIKLSRSSGYLHTAQQATSKGYLFPRIQADAVMLFTSSIMVYGKATICKAFKHVFLGFTKNI